MQRVLQGRETWEVDKGQVKPIGVMGKNNRGSKDRGNPDSGLQQLGQQGRRGVKTMTAMMHHLSYFSISVSVFLHAVSSVFSNQKTGRSVYLVNMYWLGDAVLIWCKKSDKTGLIQADGHPLSFIICCQQYSVTVLIFKYIYTPQRQHVEHMCRNTKILPHLSPAVRHTVASWIKPSCQLSGSMGKGGGVRLSRNRCQGVITASSHSASVSVRESWWVLWNLQPAEKVGHEEFSWFVCFSKCTD